LVGVMTAAMITDLVEPDEHEPLTEDVVASECPDHHVALKHVEPDEPVVLPAPPVVDPPPPLAFVDDGSADAARFARQRVDHQNRVAQMMSYDAGQATMLATPLRSLPFVDDRHEEMNQRRRAFEEQRRTFARMASDIHV